MARMNTWNTNRIRGNADKVMGMQALVLTTVGAAHPDNVQIQVAGRTIAVSAEQLHGNGRQQAWRHITSTAKRFADMIRKPTANCRSSACAPGPFQITRPGQAGTPPSPRLVPENL
jgi:hypothetical protein